MEESDTGDTKFLSIEQFSSSKNIRLKNTANAPLFTCTIKYTVKMKAMLRRMFLAIRPTGQSR